MADTRDCWIRSAIQQSVYDDWIPYRQSHPLVSTVHCQTLGTQRRGFFSRLRQRGLRRLHLRLAERQEVGG